MSKFKKYQCKCSICNKPFSSYSKDEDKCRKCKEDEQIAKLTADGYAPLKVLVRNRHDGIHARMAVLDAELTKIAVENRIKNEVAKTVVCKNCGNTFDLTVGEIEWYSKHNLAEPVRCPSCRKKRKLEMANRT